MKDAPSQISLFGEPLPSPLADRWAPWIMSYKADPRGRALADRHYSRRKIGAPQFMPPGETIVLITPEGDAVWGWWRPHPESGLEAMNGLDGWTCSIFRNESARLSSVLVLAAERALVAETTRRYKDAPERACGPAGMLSYVFDAKIRSTNPGYCYKKAGWIKHPTKPRSADGRKTLLWKPFERAGMVEE